MAEHGSNGARNGVKRRIGLVLGAGGVVGHAFHAGVLAALAEATGWDARDAEVIVGTSAGSVVGALLRAGLAPADVAAHMNGGTLSVEGARLVETASRHGAAEPIPSRAPRRGLPAMAAPGMLLRAGRQPFQTRLGVLAAAALPPGRIHTEVIVGGLRALVSHAWPSKGLWVNAVRLDTGARVAFGRDGAVRTDLATAVAASCAIPGFFAPVSIDGVRYVDGGAHSPTNADLLAGVDLDLVVVSSPMSVVGRPLRLDLGNRRLARHYLARESAEIRRSGTPVVSFEPTGEDLAVMGLNAMDGARAPDVVARAHESAVARLAHPDVEDQVATLTTAGGRVPHAPRRGAIRLLTPPSRPADARVPATARVAGRRNGKDRLVERGSVQHGARLDDEMAHEVAPLTHGAPEESRAREDLEHEPPGDGEPTPDALVTSHGSPAPGALGHDELELRSDIARHLRPSAFPADSDALVSVAEDEGASDAVLARLASLPRGVEFAQVSDVWRSLGGEVEHREVAQGPAPGSAAVPAGAALPATVDATAAAMVVQAFQTEAVVDPAAEAPDAAVPVPDEPVGADAPGCNLAALAMHAAFEAIAGTASAIRRVVPFV